MNRLTLPIQTGRKYVRRDGVVVTTTSHPSGDVFVTGCGGPYLVGTGNGLRHVGRERPSDLVADYVEPAAKGHTHAASMLLYAQDAAETDKPWLRWQFRRKGCDWESLRVDSMAWNPFTEYRRKPKTIRIGEFDVPEPLRVAPGLRDMVWLVNLGGERAVAWHWANVATDQCYLRRGLFHATREAAERHSEALLSLSAP